MASPLATSWIARRISAFQRTFEQVAASPCPHGCEHRVIVLQHGQRQDGDVRTVLDDPSRRLDTVESRHADVHQHDIWLDSPSAGDRLVTGSHLPGHLEEARGTQQSSQTIAEPRIVFRDQHSDWVHHAVDPTVNSGDGSLSTAEAEGVSTGSGNMAVTRVPPVGTVSIEHVPPNSAARSRIEANPTPARRSTGNPHPSSRISIDSAALLSISFASTN